VVFSWEVRKWKREEGKWKIGNEKNEKRREKDWRRKRIDCQYVFNLSLLKRR